MLSGNQASYIYSNDKIKNMSWGANEWAALGGILSAIATAASAYYAAVAAKGSQEASENSQRQIKIAEESRKVQIVPHVVIHSIPEKIGYKTVHLVVEDVGYGAAINVIIKIIEGEDFKIYDQIPISEWSPIKNGIVVLPSGRQLSTKLGQLVSYENGKNHLLDTDFIFEVSYEDIEGRVYSPKQYRLDVRPLFNTVSSKTEEQRSIEATESLAASLKSLAEDSKWQRWSQQPEE